MYVPEHFRGPDEPEVFEFLARHDFATLVTPSLEGLQISHVPLVVRAGPHGHLLVGHLARANPHWYSFDGHAESVAIFHGPHGYVSPSWYEGRPAVPTWNYAVVHVVGRPMARADEPFKAELVAELAGRYESSRAKPWRVEALPGDFHHAMLSAIVGFEMPIERIESKFKLSQNRSPVDRAGVIRGLEGEGTAEALALAALMRDADANE